MVAGTVTACMGMTVYGATQAWAAPPVLQLVSLPAAVPDRADASPDGDVTISPDGRMESGPQAPVPSLDPTDQSGQAPLQTSAPLVVLPVARPDDTDTAQAHDPSAGPSADDTPPTDAPTTEPAPQPADPATEAPSLTEAPAAPGNPALLQLPESAPSDTEAGEPIPDPTPTTAPTKTAPADGPDLPAAPPASTGPADAPSDAPSDAPTPGAIVLQLPEQQRRRMSSGTESSEDAQRPRAAAVPDNPAPAATVPAALPAATTESSAPAPSFDENAVRAAIVDKARSLVGIKESPDGCNCGPGVDELTGDRHEAWCAHTVSVILRTAGVPFDGGSALGLADDSQLIRALGDQGVEGYYRRHGAFADPGTATVKVGDTMMERRTGGGHVETIVWVSADGNSFTSIGGNVGNAVRVVEHPDFRSDGDIVGIGDPVAAWLGRHPELTAAPAALVPAPPAAPPAPTVIKLPGQSLQLIGLPAAPRSASVRPLRLVATDADAPAVAEPAPEPSAPGPAGTGGSWSAPEGASQLVSRQVGQLAAFQPQFQAASASHDVPAAILGAIALRETNAQNVVGDHGHGRGVMQVDDRSHAEFIAAHDEGMDPASNIDYAAALLRSHFEYFQDKGLGDDEAWCYAVAAYNAGRTGATEALAAGNPDFNTTGNDYAAEVMSTFRQLVAAGIQ